MAIELEIRNKIANEEFDYVTLLGLLDRYAHPRDKITRLLSQDLIRRVKKGLYVFGPALARRPFSQETLANLIYGPSYISFDYALSFHSLIPERVVQIQSATMKRTKTFRTPQGVFSYQHVAAGVYPLGVLSVALDPRHQILIASIEKALADKIANDPSVFSVGSTKATRDVKNRLLIVEEYLFQSLRIDRNELLRRISIPRFQEIARAYRSAEVTATAEYFQCWSNAL